MLAQGTRASVLIASLAAIALLGPAAARAADASCNLSDLAAISPPSPLDRSEEPFLELDCARAAALAIEHLNADLARANRTRAAAVELTDAK